ncbi:MAG: DUF3320 domain-containing protein [Muribaculaceae bacterium]|nr:DUF3320 domain-containing protein [Muribaculaceae bacterium]
MSVEVSLKYLPVINFSMQQNHVAVIREVGLKNTGESSIEGLEVVINFDPAFAEPVSLRIDNVAEGGTVELTDIPVHISTTFLSNLTERIEGHIRVEVKRDEEVLTAQTYEISLLAFDQWGGLAVLPAMLAAFVTPNHPEITPIIRRASEILGKWTGSPSFDEYQTRDPNRVKLQMAAIYEAIAEQQITYCTVPASFEDYGQRVRLYSDILSGKLGNCLDMTLLYAGCLEAVGIHPLITIIKGHAFAGGWLVAESFPDSVNDDVSLLTKRAADGINEILMVECTCMNTGMPVSFDKAVISANDKLKDTDNFLLFIDVLRARNARIRPLPLRVLKDGDFEIVEEEPAHRDANAPTAMSATYVIGETDHVNVEKQTIWERKLLDLSLRNNLLNTRITKNTLQLISANVNELEDALAAGMEFQVLPKPSDWDNPLMSAGIYQTLNASNPIVDLIKSEIGQKRLYSYLNSQALTQALTHLYRSSRLSLEENGANTLYLAIGLLKWFETPASTRPRFAPILLLPIEIIRKSAAKGYVIRSRDEEAALNITLLEMLRQDFGIGISGLDPLPTDESGVDVPLIFSVFRRAIMAQTGWDVEEQAIIGNFSFNKFIMWNDIHNNADKLSRNKIVSSLITGKTEWTEEEGPTEETEPDEAYPAGSVALPIGADSSQFEAICAAVDDKSFILHGPPGTGKSQTITNIIANALYQGKKVLFVAEKMAALQVVQRRLEAIGLAPFCLELHSNKTKKSYILEQLKRTTEVSKRHTSEEFRMMAAQINELRRELNGYVKALHRKHGAGLSLYDCFTRYVGTDYDGNITKIPEERTANLQAADIAGGEVAAAEYEAISKICGSPVSQALRGVGLREYRASIKSDARVELSNLRETIGRYEASLRETAAIFKIDTEGLSTEQQTCLNEILRILLEAETLPAGLLKAATDEAVVNTIELALKKSAEKDAAKEALTGVFRDSIFSWDFRIWESKWRESYGKWWLLRILDQRKVKAQLKSYSKGKTAFSEDEVGAYFNQLEIYASRKLELEGPDRELAPVLGPIWNKENPDRKKIADATKNSRELNRQLLLFCGDISKASELRASICTQLECGIDTLRELHGGKFKACIEEWRNIEESCAKLRRMLDTENLTSLPLPTLLSTISRWYDNLDCLHDRAAYNHHRKTMIDLGYECLVKDVESGRVAVANISACFAKSLYRCYAEYILSKEPGLNVFHGSMFDEKVARFKQMSAEFERLTREELFAKLASGLPALQKEAAQGSEVGILQRNIRNGGRGTSIRKLFDQIPDLLTRMCPCMLMSPISVAQYIDAGRAPFDLVIFDEASQMPTSEAVGAIARGKNVVVVGDPKQMPPTNFFSTNTFDEDNADKEDMENILEDCLALTMPSKYLLWHYRSKHESLIAFSNVKYYDNKLLTFPSPDDLTTKVKWQHVEGVYDRGKTRQNRAEAEAVVEEIRQRLSDPACEGKSIGVVTFNTNQQSLIEDMLTELFRRYPELETKAMELDEPIFIKNLENVQGDERDVILFSIGYGPDKEGKIALNFGPLNRDGGRRRLNVAVSRARYEMKVFSTLKAEQIDLNRTSAEGVADLKAFLEYAEKGRDYLIYNSGADAGKADALVSAISKALERKGYAVRTNIGCSGYKIDIGVVDPLDKDKYLIGILCDGYHYASAKTANDRVVTQDSILRLLGWRLHRVWSMDWWENPEKTVNSIVLAIEKAKTDKDTPAPEHEAPEKIAECKDAARAEKPTDVPETPENAEGEADPYIREYTLAELDNVSISSDEFVSGMHDRKILAAIATVVEAEAPISKALLCKRVINSFGISRMGPRIASYMDRLLAASGYASTGSDAEFYWKKAQDPANYAIYRPVSGREALDIAPEEIAAAIYRILDEQVSLPVDNLKREIAQTFNYARLGDNVNAAVQRAIDYAIGKKRIVLENDRLKLAN